MIRVKAGKRKVVASALTFCFFLQQSFCLQVVATNISGIEGNNGIYNIDPSAINGDIGFRKYHDFELSSGDIANLIFHNATSGQDISTFVNLVDNQINIQGIVNSVNKSGEFTNGNVVFVSPNGMLVGSSGVLNVGSLSVMTPDSQAYEKYKSDLSRPSLIQDYESRLSVPGTGTVQIDGKVLARNAIDINAANVNITDSALMMAGVKDSTKILSNMQAENLFNKLVNTDNLNPANGFSNDNGSIVIKSYGSDGGTNIAGSMKNFGKGNIEITNTGSKGINISGSSINGNGDTLLVNNNGAVNISGSLINQNGKLSVDNTGSGVLIASTGLLNNKNGELLVTNSGNDGIVVNGKVNNSYGNTTITNTGKNGVKVANGALVSNSTNSVTINNTGAEGINVLGNVSANGININNKNSNVVLGDKTGKDYLTSTGDVNIKIDNGSLLNYGTTANLIKADKNLNIEVKDGTIGQGAGNCADGACTGVDPNSRDFNKSININVGGKIKATTTDTKGSGNNYVINMASRGSDMNIDRIKADGRVILISDYDENGKSGSLLNASSAIVVIVTSARSFFISLCIVLAELS